jgi:hypothetical protein
VTAIKKKFYHQNPHAALYALQVLYLYRVLFLLLLDSGFIKGGIA